ncbi:MAG: hypothetical protein JWL85_728 [Candidatus Saccharibacteria bacterium]|nr:hypothetical protein [Candidatus Saccharibacteria bacterium]
MRTVASPEIGVDIHDGQEARLLANFDQKLEALRASGITISGVVEVSSDITRIPMGPRDVTDPTFSAPVGINKTKHL